MNKREKFLKRLPFTVSSLRIYTCIFFVTYRFNHLSILLTKNFELLKNR